LQDSCCGADYLFSLSVRVLEFLLFDGSMGLSCSHSGEDYVSVPSGIEASYNLQSSRVPLSGGAGFPALRQERLYSPVSRHVGKLMDLWAPWGCCSSDAVHRVAGYSFPPLSRESGILAL
jgi:hypothetical protein